LNTPVAVRVLVQNRTGRKGVPLAPSFARWIAAIADKRLRGGKSAQVNIVIVGAREGRSFNQRYRDKDYATNVLSFGYEPRRGEDVRLLGDLVICAPVVAREAREQGKVPAHHYAHLAIHGVLHLLGYDHEVPAQAEQMERLERRVLAKLRIPDPYRQSHFSCK